MTEAEWLASVDPQVMLVWLTAAPGYANDLIAPRVSDRKLRLFACALFRAARVLKTDFGAEFNLDTIRKVEEAPELSPRLHARGWALCLQKGQLHQGLVDILEAVGIGRLRDPGADTVPAALQAALLREIVGNPWRPVTLPQEKRCRHTVEMGVTPRTVRPGIGFCGVCGERCDCPWLTPRVLSLAQACYERAGRKCVRCGGNGWVNRVGETEDGEECHGGRKDCPDCHGTGSIDDGTLDPYRLAVLSDALEEAGCTEEAILQHLRGEEKSLCPPDVETVTSCFDPATYDPDECTGCGLALDEHVQGPHVRGCHVLDLLLGKE